MERLGHEKGDSTAYRPSKKKRNSSEEDTPKSSENPNEDEYARTVRMAGVDPEHVDSILAKEMMSMSVDDRQQLYFDVHGVSQPINESPELVSVNIQMLRQKISSTYNDTTTTLGKALIDDEHFVLNESFLIMFLRAEDFEVARAAKRLERFFEIKLELFGIGKLCQDLHMDDLDKEAQMALYSGRFQYLHKDRVGRIIAVLYVQSSKYSIRAKAQAKYYISSVTCRDENVQKRGLIGISYMVGQDLKFFDDLRSRKEWNRFLGRWVDAVPLKIVAIHYCHNSISVRFLTALFQMATSTSVRLKCREHYGDIEECGQQLRSFGISIDSFKIDKDGKIPLKAWHNHLETIRAEERNIRESPSKAAGEDQNDIVAQERSVTISYPSRQDVLLGRGKSAYRHSGNIQLRNFVEERVDRYRRSSNREKAQLCDEIVDMIQKRSGYFLEADGDKWKRVNKKVAKLKVAHLFRR